MYGISGRIGSLSSGRIAVTLRGIRSVAARILVGRTNLPAGFISDFVSGRRRRGDSNGVTGTLAIFVSFQKVSIEITSGAASWIAFSMAVFNVTDDEGQPLQLPTMRSRTA